MGDGECICKTANRPPSDLSIADINNPIERIVSFGKVEVGVKKWETLHLHNPKSEECTITIIRNPDMNPLYQCFGFNTYKLKVPPKSMTSLRIFYQPTHQDVVNVDTFKIVESGIKSPIKTTGMGIGPAVQTSTAFLRFHAFDERPFVKHTVELRNTGEVAARYYFDLDKNDTELTLDRYTGTIDAGQYIYVKITFAPKVYGVYSYQLECLILNHDPIIINAIGTYSEDNYYRSVILTFYPHKYKTPYSQYMLDVQNRMNTAPICSLSEMYLDFGGVPVDEYGKSVVKSAVTSLTNHYTSAITVVWQSDPIFNITPATVEIPAKESALLEIAFQPDKPDMLYGKKLTANVFWHNHNKCTVAEARKQITVPILTSVKLMGHSFFENTYWLPQLQIVPEIIVLRTTIPGCSSYKTFYLKTGGYLPVSFKFQPPKTSNFIVKPMLGIVEDCKLLVVQLFTEPHEAPKAYVEQWFVLLNGQSTHRIPFLIKGYSENVNVVIGDNNRVRFGAVPKGCIAKISVRIKNYGSHYIQYSLKLNENETRLEIVNPVGHIAGNEEIYTTWFYQYTVEETYKTCVTCVLYNMAKSKEVLGRPTEVTVDVYAESSTADLCSIPYDVDLGTVECHCQTQSFFELHNFGNTTVDYRLIPNYVEQNGMVIVGPVTGSIHPRSGQSIHVEYTPKEPGLQIVEVYAAIRMCESGCETVKNSERLIFTVRCNGIYPSIQVIDIVYQNYGPLFTKRELWKMLHLDELNTILKTLKSDQNVRHTATLPECEQSEDKFEIILVVRNITHISAQLALKRRKVCDCTLTPQEGTMTRRSLAYMCPHRDMFQMKLDDPNVPPLSITNIFIHIHYTVEGLTVMSYTMELTHDRCITLEFGIKTLLNNSACISKYSDELMLKMLPVCLCEQEPVFQCFWLYNNTGKQAEFILETSQLEEINKSFDFSVISCWNPCGIIESYSSVPLMFKFHPIEKSGIELKLPLQLGTETKTFKLLGSASKSFRSLPVDLIRPPAVLNIISRVSLSTDIIDVNPLPVWSETKRIFFIKNMSKDKFIGYSWKTSVIGGVVEACVLYNKGVLRPREVHTVVVRIRSFGKPCRTKLNMSCKLLDHTQYYLHKKTLDARKIMQKKLNEEFTITEDGVFYPKNTVQVVEFPEVFYRTISINIMITGVADQSLQYTTNERMRHWPQFTLRFKEQDYGPVFKKIDPLDTPIPTKNREEKDESGKQVAPDENDGANMNKFCKNFFEIILGDVVMSEFFHDILLAKKDVPAKYYSQIKRHGDTLVGAVNNLYNDPQPPIVTDILHEALTDGVHQIFNFALPQTHRGNKEYVKEIDKMAQKLICNHTYKCGCKY